MRLELHPLTLQGSAAHSAAAAALELRSGAPSWSLSALSKAAWRRGARYFWAPGVPQKCDACTTSAPFWRWASPNWWTSGSGTCNQTQMGGGKSYGRQWRRRRRWWIDGVERNWAGPRGNRTCWVGAVAALERGPQGVWACGRAAGLEHRSAVGVNGLRQCLVTTGGTVKQNNTIQYKKPLRTQGELTVQMQKCDQKWGLASKVTVFQDF